ELTVLSAFVLGVGYDWISAGSGLSSIYLRSALYGSAVFLGLSVFPIMAKWALIGRWQPGRFPIWSLRYVTFWFVKLLIQRNPLVLFVGSPIYVLYLRALGARIGRGAVILSGNVPVCTDLLTIGDNTVVRKDSSFTCHRAQAGMIEMGPVTLGRDAFVGELTVLDIDTSLGDGAQLGHASSLHAGQVIPDGAHLQGSPAKQQTEVDYRAVAPTDRPFLRRAAYSFVQLLLLFAVTLPLATGSLTILAEWRISPDALLGSSESGFTSLMFYRDVLVFSLVLFFGFALVRLVFVGTIPRLLNLAIEQDKVYPLYGFRYWAHRAIGRLTNVVFFTTLFGDSSYIVHYLYWLGYRVSFEGQTGANFGLNVKHDNPYAVTVGPGTMVADGLSIINADYSSTSFRVSPVTIGSQSFIGNQVGYPSQAKTGENCLHASKVLVPVEGEVREGVGFLGSPSFEIPRLVMRDRKFDELKAGDVLARRLAAKNKHNAVTIGLYLLSRWVLSFVVVLFAFGAAGLYQRFGPSAIVAAAILSLVFRTLYYVLVERAAVGFRALEPLYCSMYDPESWRIERYWKLSWQPALFNGTPFKSIVWRLMGVRIGKRVFDDGCLMIEKTMITVGDDCVLNAASVVQPHSQEDGTFKSDDVTIGAGCTLGVGALVHYGVTMGDGATLAPAAFLMKGAEVPPHTHWGENPAREIRDDRPVETMKTIAVPPLPPASGAVSMNGAQHSDGRYTG
ncbi:MAG: peptide synthetase, partial [Acidimicrobiia bacterium]|nr:peptide synthetase [Acidimicrobiia bacterium]